MHNMLRSFYILPDYKDKKVKDSLGARRDLEICFRNQSRRINSSQNQGEHYYNGFPQKSSLFLQQHSKLQGQEGNCGLNSVASQG